MGLELMTRSSNLFRCCFLDRDGVVNREVDYLFEPDRTVLEEDIVPALRSIHRHGFLAVVVTNQSGVARGMYGEADVHAVHARIQQLLGTYGEKIDAFYYCPHHPEITGECDCRKPLGGMLRRAAAELGIDLSQSLMIGDRISDVKAGLAAGCARSYLVRTGYGSTTLRESDCSAVTVADNALAAFEDFLNAGTNGASGRSKQP